MRLLALSSFGRPRGGALGFAAITTCLLSCQAFAGAWTLASGEGQIITTTARKVVPAGKFFSTQNSRETNGFRIFVEYGVMDDLTVGLTGSFETVTQTADLDMRVGGHVRYRFWQSDAGAVASVQLGGSYPFSQNLVLGGPSSSAPVRDLRADVLYGQGWATEWGNTFVSTSLGYRWRDSGIADEVRLEATSGLHPTNRWMGLMNMALVAPLGGSDGLSMVLSPSIVYIDLPYLGQNDKKPDDPGSPSSYQLFVSYDVLRPDDGLEVGFSIWNRF